MRALIERERNLGNISRETTKRRKEDEKENGGEIKYF